MILLIGKRNDDELRAGSAFTLIEFVIVMALLATVMAVAAPSLSRFFRQRNLEQEAARMLALTQYGQSEAISQGIPMVLWVDPVLRRYGLEPKLGYPVRAQKLHEFVLNPDLHLDAEGLLPNGSELVVAEFAPDGSMESTSLNEVFIEDRWGSLLVLTQQTNGWGYEILRKEEYEDRLLLL